MESLADLQQDIATSPRPSEEFHQLTRGRQREVFFQLPETVQRSLVEEWTESSYCSSSVR